MQQPGGAYQHLPGAASAGTFLDKIEAAARTHAPKLTQELEETVGRVLSAVGVHHSQSSSSNQPHQPVQFQLYQPHFMPYPQNYPLTQPQQHQYQHQQQNFFSHATGAGYPQALPPATGPYPYPYPHPQPYPTQQRPEAIPQYNIPPQHQQYNQQFVQHPYQQAPYPNAYQPQQQQWQQQQWQQQQWQQQQQQQPLPGSFMPVASHLPSASNNHNPNDIPIVEATVVLDSISSSYATSQTASAQPHPLQQQQQQQMMLLQKLLASAVPASSPAAQSLVGRWWHQDGALLSDLQLRANGTFHWLKQIPLSAVGAVGNSLCDISNSSNPNAAGAALAAPGDGKNKLLAWMKRTQSATAAVKRQGRKDPQQGELDSNREHLLLPEEQAAAAAAAESGFGSSNSQQQQQQGQDDDEEEHVGFEWLGVWRLEKGNAKQGQVQLTFVVQQQQLLGQQQVLVIGYQRQALDDTVVLDGIAHIKTG